MTTIAAGQSGSYTFTELSNVTVSLDSGERALVVVLSGAGDQLFSDRVSSTKTIGPFPTGAVLTVTADGAAVDYAVSTEKANVNFASYTGKEAVSYATDPITGLGVLDARSMEVMANSGVAVLAGLVADSQVPAVVTANRTAIQAALNAALAAGGGEVTLATPGVVYTDGPVYYGDNTTLKTANGTIWRQAAGTNNYMLAPKSLIAAPATVTVAWTAGNTATVTWANHGCAENDWAVFQGAAESAWWSVLNVFSVTGANTLVVTLPFTVTASPTGTITAVRCVKGCDVDVSLDYNFTNNNTAGNNLTRMAAITAFISDSAVNIRAVGTVYKYGHLVAGAANLQGSGVTYPRANSDTLKLYGPLRNVHMRVEGQGSEDCATMQAMEPAAFINYMPCRGSIHGASFSGVSAGANAGTGPTSSGALVIYSDDTFEQNALVIENGEARSSGNAPAVAIKIGSGFTPASSKLRDLTLRNMRLSATNFACLEVTTTIQRLEIVGGTITPANVAGLRAIRVANPGNVRELVISDLTINAGAWPAAANYWMEVTGGGTVDTLIFRRLTVTGSANFRQFLATSGCAVKTVIFDECHMTSCDSIARIEQAGITVVIRGGVYTSCLTLVNMRASGRVVIEGNPVVTGATNGVVRAEITATVVDLYASVMPQLSGGALLFVCLNTATINPKSACLQLDLTATGVNKAAGNLAFATATAGTIPANRSVVCNGTNWLDSSDLTKVY